MVGKLIRKKHEDKVFWKVPLKKYYPGIKQFETMPLVTLTKNGSLDFKGLIQKIGWKYITVQIYGPFEKREL